jgi:hypothetical protein
METGACEVAGHWDEIYGRRLPTELSWYQDQPTVSLALLDALGVAPERPIVDVYGWNETYTPDCGIAWNRVNMAGFGWIQRRAPLLHQRKGRLRAGPR